MKLKPMLFNGQMVRALLAGQKTQTRRIVKSRTGSFNVNSFADGTFYEVEATDEHGNCGKKIQPISVGNVIWVRETWAQFHGKYIYRADVPSGESKDSHEAAKGMFGGWKPSLFMPYAACRIWLNVTDVRAERLGDITLEDARAEGIVETWGDGAKSLFPNDLNHEYDNRKSVENYAKLWEMINGPGSWDANPWVFVYTFELTTKPQ